jgi:hypothetical protein
LNPVTEIRTTSVARLVSRNQLKPDELERMYRLLCEHFDGVTIEQFHRDTAEKNWIVLVEHGLRLVGFSTILAYETSVDGEPFSVIYSGDTIVAPEAWNSSTLPRAWIESVASLHRLYPRGPYVWLLLTSGFRTYRYLPLFWRDFFPRFASQIPAHWKTLVDALALARFGPQYHPAEGIVRFENPQRLRGPLAAIPSGREADPHVAFFAARNPGYVDGDELVCITELSPRNLTSAGRRMASAIPRWCQW